MLSGSSGNQNPCFTPPFSAWHRASDEPILGPRGTGFESRGVFNPAVIIHDGMFVMLYRAQGFDHVSRIGYATSGDGIHFTRHTEPVLIPKAECEERGGVEDPRLVQCDGVFYLTYTGYDRKKAQLCLAISHDLIHWERKGVILPAYEGLWNVGWTKSVAIVSEKLCNRYWMYYLGEGPRHLAQMGVACSADLVHWSDGLDRPVLGVRPGKFDSKVVEPGPPPVLLPQGILLIYNGADDRRSYAPGWALFDRTDPTKVLARADKPILQVECNWERSGKVPNVIFVEGLVRERSRWIFYYGSADTYIGVAMATVPAGG